MNKRLQYSQDAMERAFKAAIDGMPVATASKTFGVPRTTLLDKVKGRSPVGRKMGPETILTAAEEKRLVEWIFQIGNCGFPPTKSQLLDSVQILLKNLKRPNNFTNGRPGRHWYEAFLRRHLELTSRVSQNLTKSRSDVNEQKIRNWFKEIWDYLEDNKFLEILEDPTRIFNCDETAFFLSPKGDKVLAKKGEKAIYTFITNDEKECITSLITCNATGTFAPPMIMFCYKRLPKPLIDSCFQTDPTWGIGRSDNGWMTGETFFEYIANIFYPWLISQQIKFPVILFLDGHTSHMTMALSQFCEEKNIILISLLPNSTHILQPLDVAVFRALKAQWKQSVQKWRWENDGKRLTRVDFAPILKSTIDSMKNIQSTVENGFRSCGLVPFNPDNINYAKYFKIPVNKKQINSQISEENIDEMKNFLGFLEQQCSDKIESFKSSREIWNGALEDTSLFNLWYSLTATVRKKESDEHHVTAEDYNKSPMAQNEISEVDVTDNIDLSNITLPIVIDVPLSSNNSLDSPTHLEESLTEYGILHKDTDDALNVEEEDLNLNCSGEVLKNIANKDEHIPETIVVSDEGCDKTENVNSKSDVIAETSNKTDINMNKPVGTNVDSEKCEEQVRQEEQPEEQQQEQEEPDETRDENDITNYNKPNNPETYAYDTNMNGENPIRELSPTPEQSMNKTDNSIVPSPFTKSLFWPEPKKVVVKMKQREKIPAVATSKQWQQYFTKKEETKKKEMERKEKNREERKRRKLEKEQNGKKNKKIKFSRESNDHNSDSSDNEDLSTQTNIISEKDYVIVNYNEQLLPGQITKIDLDEDNETIYEVNHMEKNGLNWRWPSKKDILIYSFADIVKRIQEPVLKNKRGLYIVKELSEFK